MGGFPWDWASLHSIYFYFTLQLKEFARQAKSAVMPNYKDVIIFVLGSDNPTENPNHGH